MNRTKFYKVLISILFNLVALSSVNASVGKFIFTIGSVQVDRGQIIDVSKGDDVLVSDVVLTGDKSRAQLMMMDGARVSIKANSKLVIDDYQSKTNISEPSVVNLQDKSVMNLIKGGLRTITGAIGKEAASQKNNQQIYEIKTAVATIGIRGTDYSLLLCQQDCQLIDPKLKDGLYLGVSQGTIWIQNNAGILELSKNHYAYVKDLQTMPEMILAPPAGVFGDNTEVSFLNNQMDSLIAFEFFEGTNPPAMPQQIDQKITTEEEDFDDWEDIVVISIGATDDQGQTIDLDPGMIISSDTSVTKISQGSIPGVDGGIFDNTDSQVVLSGTDLLGFVGSSGSLSIGSAQNLNSGFDEVSGISWGRWSNGDAVLTDASGIETMIDLNEESMHWLLATDQTLNVAISISGTVSYSLVGNTDPTNNLGATGVLGAATLTADFTNQIVNATVLLGISDRVWDASGSGSIANGTANFNGTFDQVSIDGQLGGSGEFAGFFAGLAEGEIPLGAGYDFLLRDVGASQEIVTGVAVFGRPGTP